MVGGRICAEVEDKVRVLQYQTVQFDLMGIVHVVPHFKITFYVFMLSSTERNCCILPPDGKVAVAGYRLFTFLVFLTVPLEHDSCILALVPRFFLLRQQVLLSLGNVLGAMWEISPYPWTELASRGLVHCCNYYSSLSCFSLSFSPFNSLNS